MKKLVALCPHFLSCQWKDLCYHAEYHKHSESCKESHSSFPEGCGCIIVEIDSKIELGRHETT